jgi:hypothetical protein
MTAPSKDEVKELKDWLEKNKSSLPPAIFETLASMLEIYLSLSQSSAKAKQMLTLLRQAMGILPKSERGRSDNKSVELNQTEQDLNTMSPEERERYDKALLKRDTALKEAAKYRRELRQLKPRAKNPEQLELALADAYEMVFSHSPSERELTQHKEKVDRMTEIGHEEGLHSTHDTTKRVDLQILVTEIECKVETVTDPETGKSVRASMDEMGPAGSTMTWRAIANLVKLTVGFAIPINRVALIIGQPEFSSGKICRILRMVAEMLMPIYIHLAEALSDSGIVSGDDTKTKIIELAMDDNDEGLAKRIDDIFGFNWPKSNGDGDKKALNVSLLMGRSHRLDPRSTIRLFRTHQGSVGNLLNRLLEWRNPKSGGLIFQGDLSTTNLPSREMRRKFNLELAGCGAHARRPFWRHKEEDARLCYFMLRGFLLLSRVEEIIDARGRTQKNVLHYRKHYGKKIWKSLLNRCLIAIGTEAPNARFTLAKNSIDPDIWPPTSDLNVACSYVVNHYKELTAYLENPFLKYTNNGSERALRIEKCFLSSSKFTKTRNGRAVTDILRTINATCVAAGLDLTTYLRVIFKNRKNLHAHPELYTPYCIALQIENEKSQAKG